MSDKAKAAAKPVDADLQIQDDSGYVVSQKKTIAEYAALHNEDESLNKWKRSLGLSMDGPSSIGEPGDDRKVVPLFMVAYMEGGVEYEYNLEDPKVLEKLKTEPLNVPERSKYHLKIRFRVQHEILTGLKYVQVSKRAGITVNRVIETLGSYAPNTKDKPYYEVELPEAEAPGGMLLRGSYTASSSFVDDDNVVHSHTPWVFAIVKR